MPPRCEAAFAAADLVVEQTFRNQRIVNCQMEPRSASRPTMRRRIATR